MRTRNRALLAAVLGFIALVPSTADARPPTITPGGARTAVVVAPLMGDGHIDAMPVAGA